MRGVEHHAGFEIAPHVSYQFDGIIQMALLDDLRLDVIDDYCRTICTVDDPYTSDEVAAKSEALRMLLEIMLS